MDGIIIIVVVNVIVAIIAVDDRIGSRLELDIDICIRTDTNAGTVSHGSITITTVATNSVIVIIFIIDICAPISIAAVVLGSGRLLIQTSQQCAQAVTSEQHRQGDGGNQAAGRIKPMGRCTSPAAGRQEENRLAASVISSPCGHSPPSTSTCGL